MRGQRSEGKKKHYRRGKTQKFLVRKRTARGPRKTAGHQPEERCRRVASRERGGAVVPTNSKTPFHHQSTEKNPGPCVKSKRDEGGHWGKRGDQQGPGAGIFINQGNEVSHTEGWEGNPLGRRHQGWPQMGKGKTIERTALKSGIRSYFDTNYKKATSKDLKTKVKTAIQSSHTGQTSKEQKKRPDKRATGQ